MLSEGDTFGYRWRWNETIGPLKDRPGRPGTWGYENTDGLGLVEYLNVRAFVVFYFLTNEISGVMTSTRSQFLQSGQATT